MSHYFILSFKDNISVIEESTDRVVIQSPFVPLNIPQYTLNVEQVSPGLLAVINILAAEGATEEHLSNLVLQTDGLSELPKFYYYLQKFINLGLICHTLLSERLSLATRIPISPYEQFQLKEVTTGKRYVLSRFVYCRQVQEQLVLESPLSHGQIILADWKGAVLISELAKPCGILEICNKIPNLSEETVKLFFSLLLSERMLWEVNQDGKIQEEENEALAQWEFHDLLFHSRTRTGRHSNRVGRTYRFLNKIKPLPAVKPKVSNETIDLYKPNIEKLKEADYPFTFILEERKSIRRYKDDEPITKQQLGEFLYRSARLKEVIQTDKQEISKRPYLNGGASYELELYVTVNICDNLPTGLYHYCPKEHQLCKISERNNYVEALLKEAWIANRQSYTPQILLIIAARFPRITWTYESIAYVTALKNVGALLQTMYLVATAMNLAPCAIGEGNSDLFAAAAGTDYYAETSIGEFILGSKPTN
jgi:SagB-type dehydrogenase family enzyme